MILESKNSFLRARKACIDYWAKAFDFTGRTNRYDFWIVIFILIVISSIIDLENMPLTVQNIWAAAWLIPSVSIIIRRLREAGYQFAWLWRSLIPFYFLFQVWILFFWLFKPSEQSQTWGLRDGEGPTTGRR